MWAKIKGWFGFKPVIEPTPVLIEFKPEVPIRGWRKGMWVMHGDTIGILAAIGDPCEVHYVNEHTGETTQVVYAPLNSFRRARFPEIPISRRGISEEQAKELGYGP